MRPSQTDDPEIWLPVRGCKKYFEVSNHGRIRRILTTFGRQVNRIVKPYRNTNGYYMVSLSANRVRHERSVARLVLFAFHGIPTIPNATASHLYPDKSNNRWDNLEWESMEDNLARMKLFPNPFGRATRCLLPDQIREIRRRSALGESHLELAKEFKICESTAYSVIKRKHWKLIA